jgi:hypothetical protein
VIQGRGEGGVEEGATEAKGKATCRIKDEKKKGGGVRTHFDSNM